MKMDFLFKLTDLEGVPVQGRKEDWLSNILGSEWLYDWFGLPAGFSGRRSEAL